MLWCSCRKCYLGISGFHLEKLQFWWYNGLEAILYFPYSGKIKQPSESKSEQFFLNNYLRAVHLAIKMSWNTQLILSMSLFPWLHNSRVILEKLKCRKYILLYIRYFCVCVYKWSHFTTFETTCNHRNHMQICYLLSGKMEELFLLLLKVNLSIVVWISFPSKAFIAPFSPLSSEWSSSPYASGYSIDIHILLYLLYPLSPCHYHPIFCIHFFIFSSHSSGSFVPPLHSSSVFQDHKGLLPCCPVESGVSSWVHFTQHLSNSQNFRLSQASSSWDTIFS